MKLNSTLALTLILLSLMAAAGIVSAAVGLAVGRDALKGVTQPDTRPTKRLANQKKEAPKREEVLLLKEEDILKSVKARMNGEAKPAKDDKKTSQAQPEAPRMATISQTVPLVGQAQHPL